MIDARTDKLQMTYLQIFNFQIKTILRQNCFQINFNQH